MITELREEIARLRTKVTKNPDNKDDIVKMEVSETAKESNFIDQQFYQSIDQPINQSISQSVCK